jgi:hypothetical protein
VLPAGRRLRVDWNQYPLHPQPVEQLLTGSLAREFPLIPSAVRAGDELTLNPVAFSDNTPGHFGPGFTGAGPGVRVTAAYSMTQNGTTIARGNAVAGIPPVRLSSRRAVIRLTLTAGRRGATFPLSPASRTVWTWRSGRVPGATLPQGWICASTPNRRCAAQPLLALDYHVAGLALDGLTAPGRQRIGLTVGEEEPARESRVTGVTARVSYDGGLIWQRAAVRSLGGRRYRLSFTAPPGVDVTLKVTAADAAGSSITETLLNGYGVGT